MLFCIAGLSLGSTKKNQESIQTGSDSPIIYGFIAIALGILCPVIFSIGGLTVRIVQEKTGYSATDLTLACYIGNNVILIVATILRYEYGTHPFDLQEYIEMLMAGVLAGVGVLALNSALTFGPAGPVFALANTQVIIAAMLDAVILGQVPTVIEIISAVLGIFGKP